jgi:hypothetical protein
MKGFSYLRAIISKEIESWDKIFREPGSNLICFISVIWAWAQDTNSHVVSLPWQRCARDSVRLSVEKMAPDIPDPESRGISGVF